MNAVTQKLKGKAQKAKGEYQKRTGHGIKGGISRAKGELNEKIGDARLKMDRKARENRDADEGLWDI
jgi:uncharacterized protein YjbJ (UPF0337 family)